jgi:hypothetical protein
MTIRLNGSTSGYTEIDAPAVAGSNTLVLPTGNGTADQALVTNGSGALSFADRGRMVLSTAQNSTSGTSIDFTGIPSWVKRITVMFSEVSTNGTSDYLVQLGDSGGIETTGYVSTGNSLNQANQSSGSNSTAGFVISGGQSTFLLSGIMTIAALGSNSWVSNHTIKIVTTNVQIGAGSKALSATLDRIRITTVNGTDTFDAGTINLLLEG